MKLLEALEYIQLSGHCAFDEKYWDSLDVVSESIKAFEIIKEKIHISFEENEYSESDDDKINMVINGAICVPVSEKERDLLKKVLIEEE